MTTPDTVYDWFWHAPSATLEDLCAALDAIGAPQTKTATIVPMPIIWWLDTARWRDEQQAANERKIA